MPRGGRRSGVPGKAYGNRSDLRVPNVQAPSPQYGVRAQQQAAQRAVPVAAPATDAVPPPAAVSSGGVAPPPGGGTPPVLPGQVTPLSAPTDRPAEPLTAGLPFGPGPGTEVLGPLAQAGSPEDELMALRAAYAAYPSEELRQLLERVDLR